MSASWIILNEKEQYDTSEGKKFTSMNMSNIKTFNARKKEGQFIYQNIRTINKSILTVQMLVTSICTICSNL